jgi:mannose-1-phosphate guanylyltransferase
MYKSYCTKSNKCGFVILGITPDRIETGYVNIHVQVDNSRSIMDVKRFVEKPNADTALQYLEVGGLLLECRHVCTQGLFVVESFAIISTRPFAAYI